MRFQQTQVCVRCSWQCLGIFAPSSTHLTGSLFLCSSGSNHTRHQVSGGPLKSAVSAQRALQELNTDTRELLGVTEENSVSPKRGRFFTVWPLLIFDSQWVLDRKYCVDLKDRTPGWFEASKLGILKPLPEPVLFFAGEPEPESGAAGLLSPAQNLVLTVAFTLVSYALAKWDVFQTSSLNTVIYWENNIL